MASRLIQDLTPEMYKKALAVIEMCGLKGVELLIYCTLRTLHEQARLYRQSRSTGVIDYKAAKLRARGFGYLADILMGVGPCRGPHVTDAGPGESWHAYGEAFDGVPMVNGKPAWSYEGSPREWNIYGQCAEEAGLNWAGRWPDFRERTR